MPVRKEGGNFEDLKVAMNAIKNKQMRVGWFETAKYPDGTSVAYVASIHEFGAPHIPPRPFLRPTIKANYDQWMKEFAGLAKLALTGKVDLTSGLDAMGLMIAGQVNVSIAAVMSPPLKPATIKRKGFSKPLVGLDRQLQQVQHLVEDA